LIAGFGIDQIDRHKIVSLQTNPRGRAAGIFIAQFEPVAYFKTISVNG
jgi:hypothetical protein